MLELNRGRVILNKKVKLLKYNSPLLESRLGTNFG